MKFEILQEELSKSLGLVSRAVASRPQLPVLSNILIEAKADGLTLSATDLELGISTRVSAKVTVEGVVSVPARMILDFVGSLPPGKVDCSLEKETLVIKSGGYRGRVQTISAEEFPTLPKLSSSVAAKIEGKNFSSAVEKVVYATAKDALRPVLTGILLEWSKNKLKLVATDGFRLATKQIEATGEGWETPVLVPARAIAEVAKQAQEGELGIVIHPKTSQIIFSMGETMVVSQLLSGNYPEYSRIIPSEFEGVVELDREELLSAMRSVHIFARDNSNVVKWVVSEEGVELSAETPEKGEAKAEVVGKLEGEGGEVVFNAKFVLDYLQSAKEESVTLSISGAMKPGMLKGVEEKDGLYIVMPINA